MTLQSRISGGNLLSRIAYPGHTLVADEEASGHEAFRVATGRRSAYTNYYESITANAQRTLTLTCDRTRAADYFVLDRGHNITRAILECSEDNFVSTPQTVFDITLPTVTAPFALDDAFGGRTEEGAWMLRFGQRAAKYWRLKIPALGASIKPKIIGAHLSLSFAFDPWRPHGPDQDEMGGESSESDYGWEGMLPYFRRVDALRIQLPDVFAYETARQAFRHYALKRPTWYVPDESQAQNALCITRPAGVFGLARTPSWFPHMGTVEYREHEALNG